MTRRRGSTRSPSQPPAARPATLTAACRLSAAPAAPAAPPLPVRWATETLFTVTSHRRLTV